MISGSGYGQTDHRIFWARNDAGRRPKHRPTQNTIHSVQKHVPGAYDVASSRDVRHPLNPHPSTTHCRSHYQNRRSPPPPPTTDIAGYRTLYAVGCTLYAVRCEVRARDTYEQSTVISEERRFDFGFGGLIND